MLWWMMANLLPLRSVELGNRQYQICRSSRPIFAAPLSWKKTELKKTKPPTSPTLQVLNPTNVLNTWPKKNHCRSKLGQVIYHTSGPIKGATTVQTSLSSILLRTNQPGKEDRKHSHHKLSALLSLMFGRSSFWCSMTNKAIASSILLECHRIKKCHVNHAFMLSCSLAPMLYHKRIKHTAAYKSAGKRRQKRFSSQVVSSVELDIWKIIVLMQHDT